MNVNKDIANQCESVDQRCQKQDQFSQDNSASGSELDSFVSFSLRKRGECTYKWLWIPVKWKQDESKHCIFRSKLLTEVKIMTVLT